MPSFSGLLPHLAHSPAFTRWSARSIQLAAPRRLQSKHWRLPCCAGRIPQRVHSPRRAKAYDIDEAVKKFAARPGRRVADPAKAAEREEAKRITQERRDANLAILRAWIAQHGLGEGMTATQIHAEVPEFEQLLVLQVGSLLTMLVKEGELTFTMDGKRHKIYSVAK